MDGLDTKQLGGIGFLIGNAALFVNGLLARMHGDTPDVRNAGMSRMTASMAWNVGAVVLARYGNVPVPKQLEHFQEKLAAHLKQEGVPLDAEALRQADAATRHGWFGKCEDYLYQHPIEAANACNAVAAAGMLTSGILRRRHANEIKSSTANIVTGALLLGGSLILMLSPERTPQQIEESGQSDTLWGAVQKRPLAWAMPPFVAADAIFGAQAWGEHLTAKALPATSKLKPWAGLMSLLSVGVMACFVGGDIMTGISSKKMHGTREEHRAAQEQIIKAAAHMLASAPEAERKALVHEAAQYMGNQQWLRLVELKPEDLEMRILNAIDQHAPKRAAAHADTAGMAI